MTYTLFAVLVGCASLLGVLVGSRHRVDLPVHPDTAYRALEQRLRHPWRYWLTRW